MIGGGGSPYFMHHHHHLQQLFDTMDGGFMEPPPASDPADAHCHALLYNLSVLRDKVQQLQLQPLVGLAVEHDGPAAAAVSSAGAVIQEIITAASSMMYAFQQLCGLHAGAQSSTAAANAPPPGVTNNIAAAAVGHAKNGGMPDTDPQAAAVVMDHHVMQQQWQPQQQQHHHRGGYGYDNRVHTRTVAAVASQSSQPATAPTTTEEEAGGGGTIIELDAEELLAKYTHYCQVCGKGFKRDANLRMHMRAHGDEYKSSAALANPAKAAGGRDAAAAATASSRSFYSCPQEGCRWNRKHAKFQPLKSVICAKNHYKRSHCPKMYVCNRCNRKHFSVLSDLRTHEKHCGDHRWVCSCGTSFSRKDKLIGHLALFTGHHPAVPLDRQPNAGRRLSSSTASASKSQLGT